MSLKRGKYSKEEEQFIIDNVHNLSVAELAEQLGRATDSVENFIIRKKLKAVVTQEDQEDINRLLGILKQSPHWVKIKMALTTKEQKMFQNDWIAMIQQFGEDVWYTEEKYIVDWLLLDIEKFRTFALKKEALQSIEDKELELALENKLDEDIRDKAKIMTLTQEIDLQKAALSQHTAALKTILERIEKISDKLKANREERRDIKANEDTYWGYIQMLEDEKYRKRESRQAQLMKKAQDKAREQMYDYHEYMDGEVDIPILTPEIALRKQEEEQYERTGETSDNV